MKYLSIVIWIWTGWLGPFACAQKPVPMQKKTNHPPKQMYPFDGYYIHLAKLEDITTDSILAKDFKQLSPFKHRFQKENHTRGDSLVIDGFKFILDHKNGVIHTHLSSQQTQSLKNPDSTISTSLNGYSTLLKVDGGIIHVKNLNATHGYKIYKYAPNGAVLFQTQLKHTHIDKSIENGRITHHHHRYLTHIRHTPKQVIFSTGIFEEKRFPFTHILDVNTGKITTLNKIARGLILDEQEDSHVEGFCFMEDTNQKGRFSIELKNKHFQIEDNCFRYNNVAKTLLFEDLLIVAIYHSFSTGSSLIAIDLEKEKIAWKASVVQVNASHSEYYNTVILSRYEDKIIMEGIESYGKYVQIFDIHTGTRLYSTLQDLQLKDDRD